MTYIHNSLVTTAHGGGVVAGGQWVAARTPPAPLVDVSTPPLPSMVLRLQPSMLLAIIIRPLSHPLPEHAHTSHSNQAGSKRPGAVCILDFFKPVSYHAPSIAIIIVSSNVYYGLLCATPVAPTDNRKQQTASSFAVSARTFETLVAVNPSAATSARWVGGAPNTIRNALLRY